MKRTFDWRAALLLVACIACWAGASAMSAREPEDLARRRDPDVVALPTAGVARLSALGFEELLADLYFVQAVQYFGNPWNNLDDYRYLYTLVDLITDLDPEFPEPLRWGAIAIQKNLGREVWVNTAESTRLLQKGARLFPDDWRFHFFLSYNLAAFDHDYKAAAKSLEKTIGLQGTPEYVPALITRLYSSAGDLQAAAALAEGVALGSDDPKMREQMQVRLVDIETEQAARQIDAAIQSYHAQKGHWPERLDELVAGGFIAQLPREPRGGTWLYDPVNHSARSSATETRLQIFVPENVRRKEAE